MNILEPRSVGVCETGTPSIIPIHSTEHVMEIPLERIDARDHHQVAVYFPKSILEIQAYVEQAKAEAYQVVKAVSAIPPDHQTFHNTFYPIDAALALLHSRTQALEVVKMTNRDNAIREAAKEGMDALKNKKVELFDYNKALYQCFKACQRTIQQSQMPLSQQESTYLDNTMRGYARNGLHLEAAEFEAVMQLKMQISGLETRFLKNIDDDQSHLWVEMSELQGVPEMIIEGLEKDQNRYKLTCHIPIYLPVMEYCQVESTRKALYHAYVNRAANANVDILQQLVASRDQLARLLGYRSFSQYDIQTQMAKTPERVEAFIDSIVEAVKPKAQSEADMLCRNLPPSVTLTPEGKIKPWDLRFLITSCKCTGYNLDEKEIQEYFPFEPTLKKLCVLFSAMFQLSFQEKPNDGFWDPSVKIMAVYTNHEPPRLAGHIVLDLFPREGKFGHAYCKDVLAPCKSMLEGVKPAIAVVIANLTPARKSSPSILKHSEVETLFHELGHALHQLLGLAEMPSLSGYHTLTDFLELPSQLLEKMLWEPDILESISEHYQTKARLPRAIIEKKIASKQFATAIFALRQMTFARMSLALFKEGFYKNVTRLREQIEKSTMPFLAEYPPNRSEASFQHYADPLYASKYYSYEFADVFAEDIYREIQLRSSGKSNVQWARYRQQILEPGGGADPNELMENFLGRPPSIEAYKIAMGLSSS